MTRTARISFGGRAAFVKTHAAPPPGMFRAEAEGLAWLAEGPLRVPAVYEVTDERIVLEWLDLGTGRGVPLDDEALGRGLAQLHALGAPSFGHAAPNFLAVLPQDNTPAADIVELWCERRLRPLFERLGIATRIDELAQHPERFGPPERPARLHGDLWSGNVDMCEGAPVIFDPAVYGGHREIDLAMLALFGSVSSRFIDAYREVWPLDPAWRERIDLWQLYPLAAHAVMFGGGYVRQLKEALDRTLRA